ncbi:MAG: STAS domain-containing protein [Mycobacterium sp.]
MSATLPAPRVTQRHGIFLSALHDAGGTIVVVNGELDAAGIPDFITYAKEHASAGNRLTVDLSKLKFLAVEGYSAIQDLRSHCNRTGTTWMLVAGPAVHRVLNICDPNRRPLAVRSLQLVPQPAERTRQ